MLIDVTREQGGSGEGRDNSCQIATSPAPGVGRQPQSFLTSLSPQLLPVSSLLKRVPESRMPGATCFDFGKSPQIFRDAGFLQTGIKAFPVPWQQFAFQSNTLTIAFPTWKRHSSALEKLEGAITKATSRGHNICPHSR